MRLLNRTVHQSIMQRRIQFAQQKKSHFECSLLLLCKFAHKHQAELIRGLQKLKLVIVIDEAHLLDKEMLVKVHFFA